MEFCMNACDLTYLSITAEESGRAGFFCNKQRVLKVQIVAFGINRAIHDPGVDIHLLTAFIMILLHQ